MESSSLTLLANLVLVSCTLSILCLLVLHFTSPEFGPSWRMVSEYALGRHKWLITSFFIFWGVASLLLSTLLFQTLESAWALIGVGFLFISGIGEIMGGLFDVKHKHHGLAFLLGVPSVPIAALLLGYQISQMENWNIHRDLILGISHATWISLIAMAIAMGVMFSGFKKAGIPMNKDAEPPKEVPPGVIALGGYANRILVMCYIGWVFVVARIYLSMNA